MGRGAILCVGTGVWHRPDVTVLAEAPLVPVPHSSFSLFVYLEQQLLRGLESCSAGMRRSSRGKLEGGQSRAGHRPGTQARGSPLLGFRPTPTGQQDRESGTGLGTDA